MTYLSRLETDILNNRGNADFIDSAIVKMTELKEKFDWQMNKFLEQYCGGVIGLQKTDLDTSSPLYRFYNFKCGQYEQVERMIRVAKAYRNV